MTKEKFIETVNSYFDKKRKTRTDNRAAFLVYANYMKSDFKGFFEFIRAKKLPMCGYGSLPSLQGAARYHYCNIRQLTSEKDIMEYADCLAEPQQLTFNFTPPPQRKKTQIYRKNFNR